MQIRNVFRYALMSFIFGSFIAKSSLAQSYVRHEDVEQEKLSWGDDGETNPYFKSGKKKTGADLKKQMQKPKKEGKKTTFKRRVYTGPTREEQNQTATMNAQKNFQKFFGSTAYEYTFKKASYDATVDKLVLSGLEFKPKKGTDKAKAIPYYLKMDKADFFGFNIGEFNNTPMKELGEIALYKIDLPVWNDKGVKVGQVQLGQAKIKGNIPEFLNAKFNGKLDRLEFVQLHSEKIINEVLLDNIVRSKIFKTSSATFRDVQVQPALFESLKNQSLEGLSFKSALIDTYPISTYSGAVSAMTSYSARVLDTDLIVGARMEAEKKKQNVTLQQLRQNVSENKEALSKLDKE